MNLRNDLSQSNKFFVKLSHTKNDCAQFNSNVSSHRPGMMGYEFLREKNNCFSSPAKSRIIYKTFLGQSLEYTGGSFRLPSQ